MLANAADHSVVISSIGFLSNLAKLVLSPPDKHSRLTGAELVTRKVKGIGVMGGGLGERTEKSSGSAVTTGPFLINGTSFPPSTK